MLHVCLLFLRHSLSRLSEFYQLSQDFHVFYKFRVNSCTVLKRVLFKDNKSHKKLRLCSAETENRHGSKSREAIVTFQDQLSGVNRYSVKTKDNGDMNALYSWWTWKTTVDIVQIDYSGGSTHLEGGDEQSDQMLLPKWLRHPSKAWLHCCSNPSTLSFL